MGYKHSFRSKAVHFVSDLTTVILNPISDDSSNHHEDENGDKEISPQPQVATESDVEIQGDGPDTSSFTAFMFSLLSSSKPDGHSNEETGDNNAGMDPKVKERTGRRSLISYGKQSLRKAIYQASRISGYRDQGTDKMVDSDTVSDEYKLRPLQVPKETLPQLTIPDISEPSFLLSENARKNLYVSLPVLVHERKWILLYSTWRHGISLSTLYRRSMLCPGLSLLVVGDRKGAVFGGLVEAPLRPSNKRKYQGTNNTFVFTNLSNQLVVYRPTGVNRYFTVCSTDFLALGGGGHFALYLDGDLLSGSSSASETFGNSCLAHSQDFEVKEVELWGFVYGSKYEETLALCRRETTSEYMKNAIFVNIIASKVRARSCMRRRFFF